MAVAPTVAATTKCAAPPTHEKLQPTSISVTGAVALCLKLSTPKQCTTVLARRDHEFATGVSWTIRLAVWLPPTGRVLVLPTTRANLIPTLVLRSSAGAIHSLAGKILLPFIKIWSILLKLLKNQQRRSIFGWSVSDSRQWGRMVGPQVEIWHSGRTHERSQVGKWNDFTGNAGQHTAKPQNWKWCINQGVGGESVGASVPWTPWTVWVIVPPLRRTAEQLNGPQRYGRKRKNQHDEWKIFQTVSRVQPCGAGTTELAKCNAVERGTWRFVEIYPTTAGIHRTTVVREQQSDERDEDQRRRVKNAARIRNRTEVVREGEWNQKLVAHGSHFGGKSEVCWAD